MISSVKMLTLSVLLFLSTTLMMSTFYGVHDGLTRIGFPILFPSYDGIDKTLPPFEKAI